MSAKRNEARLVLEDGTTFSGYSFGYPVSREGEVVFNTGMTGYPQSLTDPSYHGQILSFTYPLIGNYGVAKPSRDAWGIPSIIESESIQVAGLIVSEHAEEYSHYAAVSSLGSWLESEGIPAVRGIDTRRLTQRLRAEGTMRGRIEIDAASRDAAAAGEGFLARSETIPVAAVSAAERTVYEAGPTRILLIDCGVKLNIIRELLKRRVTVIRVPWDADISRERYDAILVSNGPGDPKACSPTIGTLRKALAEKAPIFGICLGNQLLALAAGADTYKLKFGHRSQNQPCAEVGSPRCYITSQNHGYAVREDSLPSGWEPWFRNSNDGTNEGIRAGGRPFFAVQFHPEAAPGPRDSGYLFDYFLDAVRASAGKGRRR
jgi:carbamoyl-phosphate synthase small subunit